MTSRQRDFLQVREHKGQRQRLRLEQRPLTVLRVHGDEPEIALFLQVRINEACISSSRLADRLDEQTFANTQLDADVVWT